MEKSRLARIREKYDDFARWYDWTEGLVDMLLGIVSRRNQLVRRAEGPVLEVGIGTGRTLPVYRSGGPVVGLELSGEMLALARRRAARSGNAVRFHPLRGDMQQLPFPDEAFQTVLSSQTLCTVPDPVGALTEMKRVCRPGGRILLIEHGLSGRPWLDRLLHRYMEHSLKRFACHPARDHLEEVRAAGLAPVTVERSHLGILVRIEARPER
jgi:ubiquinone/menaquinone biosynthesis C-methylase UbiE